MDYTSSSSSFIQQIKDDGYPRPTTKCPVCGGTLIFCCGEKIRPHFRHASNPNSSCSGGSGESVMHKYAKEIICGYLNSGHILHVEGKCQKCPHSWNYQIPTYGLIFKEEQKYKTSKFDVAAIDQNYQVVCGIEIFHTHKTTNVKDRNELRWFEFSAEDVIEMNSKKLTENIILDRRTTCNECCLLHMELDNIARTLGYLSNVPYEYPGSRIMDMAMMGKYQLHIDHWINYPKKQSYEILSKSEQNYCWNYLIEKGICLKCKEPHNVTRCIPYCRPCFDYNKQHNYRKRKDITTEQRDFLREKIKWLSSIPDTDQRCIGCVDCHCKTKYVKSPIWYYDHKKKISTYKEICEHCLNERMERDGLIEMTMNW